MLEERLNELFKIFGLADRNAVTFGHPKMKIKWILPMIEQLFTVLNSFSRSLFISILRESAFSR